MGEIIDRAKRIDRIRLVRKAWSIPWIWRNHTTASHEFQLLDVLRDIRLVLTGILIMLALVSCHREEGVVVRVVSAPAEAA